METITTEIAAIQVKSLYLHFKTVKINESILNTNKLKFANPASPEALAKKGELLFDVIDAITLFENYHSLCDDVLNSRLIGPKLTEKVSAYLKNLRKIMAQWKHVRNKLGGHLNIENITSICDKHNFKGVFISNFIEADFKAILLNMLVEESVNSSLNKSQLFEGEITLTNPSDLGRFVTKFMENWNVALNLNSILLEFLYDIGKSEKLKVTNEIGIIKF
ncbi:MAG: hypothetical protein IPJ51_23110 [Saprospiraceae bacterium]|nr:hypothetical protein [Saprospiraceae bacterium]